MKKNNQTKSPRFFFLIALGAFLLLAVLLFDKITYTKKIIEKINRRPKRVVDILKNQSMTEHFNMLTDLDFESLDYYHKFFEGFFEYFDGKYFEIDKTRHLDIYLFKNTRDYEPFAKSAGFDSYTPLGFYYPTRKLTIVNHEMGIGVLLHEMSHHFVAVSFKDHPPPWANESIATFHEKFIGYFDENGKLFITFGYFNQERFKYLKEYIDEVSLLRLISSSRPYQNAVRSLMLFLHKKGLFEKFVKDYFAEEKDIFGHRVLQNVYGKEIDQIEKEWKQWVKAQPIDEEVKLIKNSFVKTRKEWDVWWRENQSRLYYNKEMKRFCLKNYDYKKYAPPP